MPLRKCILFMLPAFLLILAGCQKDVDEVNKVPIANAGASQTITLPVDSVTLTGTGTDADGKVVAYLWSQVAGPAATTIVNPGSPSTAIKGFVQGTYIFQLMVTDEVGATGVDTAVVVVNPNPVKTLILQPNNNPTEYLLINENGSDLSGLASSDIPVEAWTRNSLAFTIRGLLKFDLSSIPANATIISANLYLYSYPSPTVNGNLIDANYGTNNTLLVQQITSTWTPGSTTWFNQPSASNANQVVVPSTDQSVLDLNVNVTSLVSSMVTANANYGFLLKLQNEVTYNSRIFVSSRNTTYSSKHPKLIVVYQ